MNKHELHLIYKKDTGSWPSAEVEDVIEFDIFRSKGQWILNVTDEEAIDLRNNGFTIIKPDLDYIEWLENKVIECYGNG